MNVHIPADLMETVAEISPNAIIGVNCAGVVDVWNTAAEELLGWAAQEIIGKALPAQLQTLSSSVRQGVEIEAATREGKTLRLEVRSRRRQPDGWLYMATDRSEIRAATESLRSESRFRELLEAAPDAIIEVDREGRIVLLNRVTETLFGYSREELLSMNVDMLLPEALRGSHKGHREDYQSSPGTRPMGRGLRLSARHHDGHEIPVEISLSPVQTQGEFRVTAIIRDVTERRIAEEKLRAANQQLEVRNQEIERADRLKTEFLASMSHELRTPLHTIIGFTELLAEELEGPLNDKQKRFVQHVRQDSVHLLDLINDILDLSKIEAGRMELQLEALDPGDVVRSAVSGIANAARAKNITLENRIDAPLFVIADRLRLREILTNLLNNAVKFTREGGSVWIEVAPEGEMFRFTVGDTGIGIAPENQGVIFDKFRQVASTTRGVREGTGLGLSIVRHLVELHGGEAKVESTPGKGSRFSFTIPGDPGRTRTQPVVLVVEDEPAGRELLANYLDALGVHAEFAESSAVATALARDLRPDAITLDLRMPGRSGWRVLEELRSSPDTSSIPVFVISVLDRDRDALALGATAYLQKPVKKETLLRALRDHVPAIAALRRP
jgi:PAS domain S-box-containing protein